MNEGGSSAGSGDAADSTEAARAAGLRYVTDRGPGIRRLPRHGGCRYVSAGGEPITSARELARIAALAIPPAWTDVWICPSPSGHLQATGRDARGRKQYRYHPRWRETRDETKYARLLAFGEALPAIRAAVARDLALAGLPRSKVLAAVVRLLEATCIRVGNEAYARQNGSFGLTTLRDDHVDIDGTALRFRFRGKAGKVHEVGLRDRRLASIVRRCRDLPGQELFQYLDDERQPQVIDSGDVNAYLRSNSHDDFTAKDFRTWRGTVEALAALRATPPPASPTDATRHVVQVVKTVAERLGNTAAVCRKCYIHPSVLTAYLSGRLPALLDGGPAPAADQAERHGLQPDERAVLHLLRAQAGEAAEAPPPRRRGRGRAA